MKEPRHTCPLIDSVIMQLNKILLSSDLEDIYSDIEDVIYAVEQIRNANSEIREWGKHLESKVSELEDEIFELRKRLELELEQEYDRGFNDGGNAAINDVYEKYALER